jgi:short chain dehydrogenase
MESYGVVPDGGGELDVEERRECDDLRNITESLCPPFDCGRYIFLPHPSAPFTHPNGFFSCSSYYSWLGWSRRCYRPLIHCFWISGGHKLFLEQVTCSDCTRRADKLSPLPKDQGVRVISVRADLSKREEIIRLVEEATKEMGRLDVVFSNGGWTMVRNFNDLDDNINEDDWDKCFNMNVKSHLWLMQATRKWLDETEGALITTASLAGVRPSGSSLVRLLIFLIGYNE